MTSPRGEGRAAVALLVAFLLVRLWFLVVREPFFDELFTIWVASQPVSELLPILRLDSGPPLYYLIARTTDLGALRLLSLAFATAGFVTLLLWRPLGPMRFAAATLIVLHPPSVIYAVDARAYALTGALITLAALLLSSRRPFAAAAALVVAAYAHFLAVLFFPILLLERRRGAAALGLAAVAFAPGAILALSQPAEAMAWQMPESPLAPLMALAYVGNYPEALLRTPPLWLVLSAAAVTLAALARAWRFAPYVLIPVGGAVVLALTGRDVYTPLRFESLLAAPLALWIGDSLRVWKREAAITLAVLLTAAGGFTLWRGAMAFAAAPENHWIATVTNASKVARRGEPVVVTGYYVLAAAATLDRPFVAYPEEQLAHPGWRRAVSHAEASAAAQRLPGGPFVIVGDIGDAELQAVAGDRGLRVLHREGPTVIGHVPGRAATDSSRRPANFQ